MTIRTAPIDISGIDTEFSASGAYSLSYHGWNDTKLADIEIYYHSFENSG